VIRKPDLAAEFVFAQIFYPVSRILLCSGRSIGVLKRSSLENFYLSARWLADFQRNTKKYSSFGWHKNLEFGMIFETGSIEMVIKFASCAKRIENLTGASLTAHGGPLTLFLFPAQ